MFKRIARLQTLGLIAVACFLAACNNTPPEDLNARIEAGNAAKALDELTIRLEDLPQDQVLHALALKARLRLCAQQQCLTKSPDIAAEKARLNQHLGALTGTVTLEDGTQLDALGIFTQAATWFAAADNAVPNTFAAQQLAPLEARPAYPNALFARLTNLAPAQTEVPLTTMLQADATPKPIKNIAGLLLAVAQNQPKLQESYLISLRNEGDKLTVPPAAAQTLVNLLRHRLQEDFTTELIPTLVNFNIPALLKPEPMAAMAKAVGRTTTVTDPSGTIPLADLRTMALSLTLNPNQPQLWQQFLPAAERAATQQNATNLFADLTRFAPLPSAIQSQFLTSLFKVIETASANKQPLLPLLRAVENIKLDKANETRLEKLVQTGLSTAITAENVDEVLAYARFRPSIAQANRQAITPLIITTIRDNLKNQRYEDILTLNEVLTKEVGIAFDLEALLLQELTEDFKTRDILGELSTDDPKYLLMQPSAAALDLGPLFAFTKQYFADIGKPDPLNDQLKTLAAAARGTYGLPTAIYRLSDAFDSTAYPPAERQAYLANAITTALEHDTARSPAELITLLGDLSILHKGMALPPLVARLLSRADTLEDSRAFWAAATGNAREVLIRTHPQFAALMQGIDAAETKQWNSAIRAFDSLATPAYAPLVAPYITQIREQLASMAGLYAAQNLPLPDGAPALIRIQPVALTRATDNLAATLVTTYNPLGALTSTNPATYATDAASIQPHQIETKADLNRLTLAPQTDAETNPFSRLTVLPGSTQATLTWQKGKTTAAYVRLLNNPDSLYIPLGTYSVISYQVSPTLSGQTILPPGSMLELTEEETNLKGKLRHPATVSPLPLQVGLRPDTMATTLAFSYPLPASSQPVKAAAKCQLWPGYGLCGAHHAHNQRNQYTTLVQLRQTQESLQAQAATLAAANATYQQQLPAILAALPTLMMEEPKVINATLTTPTGVTLLGSSTSATVTQAPQVSASAITAAPISPQSGPLFATTPQAELLPAPVLSEESE